MGKELFEAVQRGEAVRGAEGLLAAFSRALERVRTERAAGLAQAEFEEGLWVADDGAWLDADLDDLALAARDAGELDFPVRYRAGDLVVLLGLGEDGEPYLLLEQGTAVVETLGLRLEPGVEVPCDVDAPPASLVLDDGMVLRP